MNGDALDDNFINEEDDLSNQIEEEKEEEIQAEEEEIQAEEKELLKANNKNSKKIVNDKASLLNKKRSQGILKYPLGKVIDFSTANKFKISKVFNQISKETLNVENLFMKNMFLTSKNIEVNQYVNGLIEFKLDSLKETINTCEFYTDKIKPFAILYSSNCYDLIKYEKILKSSFDSSSYNMVVLNFFGKHKKLKEEVTKIRDRFNKSKTTPNTFYVILTTPNRILKLSQENILDYSFLKFNILDLTPNIKNMTFLDMKDCREDFFNFVKKFLITDNFNKSRYVVYLNK